MGEEKLVAFGILNHEDVIILHDPLVVSEERVDWFSGEELDGVWQRGLLILPKPSPAVRELVERVHIPTPVEKKDFRTFTYKIGSWELVHVLGNFSFGDVIEHVARLLGKPAEELARKLDEEVMSYYEEGLIDLDGKTRVLLSECGFILARKERDTLNEE